MSNAGRKRAIDDEVKSAIIGYLKAGGSMTGAAGAAGVGKTTVYDEMERSPDFRSEVEKARSESEMQLVSVIRAHACEEWKAAAWCLERLHGQEYGNLQKHEVSGKDGAALGPLITFVDKQPTDDTPPDPEV